jgi:hypothetical protein
VCLLQRSAVARDVCVVHQNVDIIYKVYDCDIVSESFKDFQDVRVIKEILLLLLIHTRCDIILRRVMQKIFVESYRLMKE